MSKKTLTPIAAVLGTTFAVSLSVSPLVQADENPFALNYLSSGYMVAEEGACGEKEGEGHCGEEKGDHEGKCGEGKCGEGKAEGEGKCGESK